MDDLRPVVRGVTLAFFAVATMFVILRFMSRVVIARKVQLHDHFMLLAWVIAFGFCFSICYGTTKGLGLHEHDVRQEWQADLNRSIYTFSVLYNPALMATKTSILVFYLTLTEREKIFRWANYITLFVVNAAGLALTFVNVFRCRPVGAAFRYPSPSDANCTDLIILYLSSAPVNIITDLAIFFLPLPILTRMHLPKKQKVILIVTFSFGAFVAVVDVVRIAYLQNASLVRIQAIANSHSTTAGRLEQGDFSWYASLSFMWSAIEVTVGIICACVPSLKPLVARLIPTLIRDSDGSCEADVNQESTVIGKGEPVSPTANGYRTSFTPVARSGDAEGPMDLIEFLMLPATATVNDIESPTTGTSIAKPREKIPFFDFVNVRKPKSMLTMNNKESLPALAMTTVLFVLLGFAYGFLDILNSHFQLVVRMSTVQLIGLHAAYFGGYASGPLLGRLVLKHWGFKATFVTGLCIYACGTLIFWPSAVLTSFVAFILSNLIVGTGLSVVETAANPFIALCGPMENSEIRLNVSQGFQAIGGVVSPLLAEKVLFRDAKSARSLIDVQWTYLGIAFFDVLLAVAFYYMPIPEASDEDLVELADKRREANSATIGKVPVVWVTLGLGVFSQFCYVGGQEALNMNFQTLVKLMKPSPKISPFDYQAIGHTLFAVGRFTSALAQAFFRPRSVLLILYVGMIVFSILAMNLTGAAGVAMGLLVYLFESGVFSMIFAISLRGMAQHTKTAAALLTGAISGGAVFPFIQNPIIERRSISYSLCVPVALFAFGSIFPLYLNLVPAAKRQVDPIPNEYLNRPNPVQRRRTLSVRRRKDSLGGRSVLGNMVPILIDLERSPEDAAGRTGIVHDLAPWPSGSPTATEHPTSGDLPPK